MMRKLILILLILLIWAGCGRRPELGAPKSGGQTPVETLARGPVEMANPASVHCEENGGVLEIRQDSSGGEYGVCLFPDGSECEEWVYFRGECSAGDSLASLPTPIFSLADYAFPEQIDPEQRYLFYVHGKIIEDQGIPAVSPEFGEYRYGEILQKLSEHGFRVISEQRFKDTDPLEYARRVTAQVQALLNAGVPPEHITVVGASKGAWIVLHVSSLVKNEKVNYVPMAICVPEVVGEMIRAKVVLTGNVLSIYDSVDQYAGSCQELFAFSEGKGIARHEEIVLDLGMGHGILYQPLDEWMIPVVEWAGGD